MCTILTKKNDGKEPSDLDQKTNILGKTKVVDKGYKPAMTADPYYADPEKKIYKLMEFTGSGRDVADPWYTGDFDATFADVMAGCSGLLEKIRREENI